MDVVLYIIVVAISGLIVGALARLLLPGRDPMTIFQTMLVGVTGSLIAGLIGYYAFGEEEGPGFLLALLCTLVLVFAIRKIRERQAREIASSAGPPSGRGG
jgi:uncharacterized membrane protein YeaQ/YmgE (transglycosylase-associated protein family)